MARIREWPRIGFGSAYYREEPEDPLPVISVIDNEAAKQRSKGWSDGKRQSPDPLSSQQDDCPIQGSSGHTNFLALS